MSADPRVDVMADHPFVRSSHVESAHCGGCIVPVPYTWGDHGSPWDQHCAHVLATLDAYDETALEAERDAAIARLEAAEAEVDAS